MTDNVTKLAKSSKTDEHFTPDHILQFARLGLGCEQFCLDPATDSSNPTNARTIYILQVFKI